MTDRDQNQKDPQTMQDPKKKTAKAELVPDVKQIEVVKLARKTLHVWVIGNTPLLLNRMPSKAKRQLLEPSLKKNRAERAATAKHDPFAEYRDSPYTVADPSFPTLIAVPSRAFKSALRNAALDVPGSATKAAIGRLTFVLGDYVPIYGSPRLHMDVVRMADMARTPDIRTRCIIPEWACRLSIKYVDRLLSEQTVLTLLDNGGFLQGVGDFRSEKGKGNFGEFRLAEEEDEPKLQELRKLGRKIQEGAMADPVPYDGDTAELLTWWTEERARRTKVSETEEEVVPKKRRGREPQETT